MDDEDGEMDMERAVGEDDEGGDKGGERLVEISGTAAFGVGGGVPEVDVGA